MTDQHCLERGQCIKKGLIVIQTHTVLVRAEQQISVWFHNIIPAKNLDLHNVSVFKYLPIDLCNWATKKRLSLGQTVAAN